MPADTAVAFWAWLVSTVQPSKQPSQVFFWHQVIPAVGVEMFTMHLIFTQAGVSHLTAAAYPIRPPLQLPQQPPPLRYCRHARANTRHRRFAKHFV